MTLLQLISDSLIPDIFLPSLPPSFAFSCIRMKSRLLTLALALAYKTLQDLIQPCLAELTFVLLTELEPSDIPKTH